jgi:hemerythrin-like domain-containing protein
MTQNKSAITLIKQDHRAVERLYREYKAAEGKERDRDRCAEEICKSLEMHAKMEETYFYPAVRKEVNATGDLMIVEAYAEHLGMKTLIKAVKALPEGQAREATLNALMAVVKHHVKEEERELLPEAEKKMEKEELMALGKKMARLSPSEKAKREESTR